jgi:hypothetical protein
MKKIFFILAAVLALSIVVFGFGGQKAIATNVTDPGGQAVRFNIDEPLGAGEQLKARIRVISSTSGAVAYEAVSTLSKKQGRYVSNPIILNEGHYRVEAITEIPGGETASFVNVHELVLNQIPLDHD